jgi:hypothetical protein
LVFLAKTNTCCGSVQKCHQHVVLCAIFSIIDNGGWRMRMQEKALSGELGF